jgi:ribonuclease BN (tRNA processing enzyme)
LTAVEKELEEAKTNNVVLTHYMNAKRKKDEDWRKEEARKKVEEGQSSKGLFPPAR